LHDTALLNFYLYIVYAHMGRRVARKIAQIG